MAFKKNNKKTFITTNAIQGKNQLNNTLRNIYSYQQKNENVEKTQTDNVKRKAPRDPHINFIKTRLTFADVGGFNDILAEIKELVILPLKHHEIFTELGVTAPRGVLFCGPSGSGKTFLAMAVANECQASLIKLSAPEIIAGVSGESESKLRAYFAAAKKSAPCLLLIDDIDVICGKKDSAQRSMERRIVAQLVSLFDDLNFDTVPVMVIATTSKPEDIDRSLRRGGRFDKEILFKTPSKQDRKEMLEKMTKKIKLDGKLNLSNIAGRTPGFNGADLELLVKEAVRINMKSLFERLEAATADTRQETEDVDFIDLATDIENVQLRGEQKIFKLKNAIKEKNIIEIDEKSPKNEKINENEKNEFEKVEKINENGTKNLGKDLEKGKLEISVGNTAKKLKSNKIEGLKTKDFLDALRRITPGFKREGFTSVPSSTWDEIGGLDELRQEMKMSVVYPILYPRLYKKQGLGNSSGVLFYGPPGCGKTLVAKAIANEAQASFISIKGPELLNMYVGETEKAIRSLFYRASTCAPCIIFFDEIESLVPKRFSKMASSEVSLRSVTQMLTEMDGLEERDGVFVISATNRPDVIDKAMLRPGRLGKAIYIPLPNSQARRNIISKHLKKIPSENEEEVLDFLQNRCDGFSGADCASLVQKAAALSLAEFFTLHSGERLKREIDINLLNDKGVTVEKKHFEMALKKVIRSVSKESERFYEAIKRDFQDENAE